MIRDAAAYAARTLRRGAKHARQRLGPEAEARALFVVGAQRSGTTMLMDVLESLPDTRVYQEYDRAAFLPDWHLRPLAERRRLIERARCRWVVFKPLFDTQHTDRLLAEHPGSKALFPFRHYRDVARSSVVKWGEAMRNAVRRLATEDPCDHWMADRLPSERKVRLAGLFHEGLSLESAAALRWWLRNEIFFDLDLAARRDRVRLVHYEALVGEPREGFAALFDFLGLDPGTAVLSRVSSRSVAKGRDAEIEDAVAALCDDTQARLLAAFAAQQAAS